LRHAIDQGLLRKARQLKIIATPTTGLNHIDLESAAQQGVLVLSLRGEVEFLRDVRATAEHTIGLMLSLLRNIPSAERHVRGGEWNRDQFKGHELYEKTAGIVGYGRLGRLVAMYLRAFGMKVIASDPHLDAEARRLAASQGVEFVPLSELLERADIVSLHVNLDPATAGFFGPEQFAQMKAGAWFVNTSRGELIDETALLGALQTGRLSGAALDVLQGEQSGAFTGSELLRFAQQHGNLLITPHIGGCTYESLEKTEIFLAQKVVVALEQRLDSREREAVAAAAR
jgi:D-3-phosphoglycerate dehydrogenase